MDHIARELGLDRKELRMRNLIRAGDEMVNGQRLDDAHLAPAMDRLGLKMNNPEFPPDEPDAVVVEAFEHLAHGPIWNVGGKEEGARYLSTIPRADAVGFMAKGAKDLHG